MFKYCATLLFTVITIALTEMVYAADYELSTQLNLFAAKAITPEYFLKDYKQAAIKFDIDFTYHFTDNFEFIFLPYIQTFYDVNYKDNKDVFARIWKTYFSYNISDFNFNMGRFDFKDENLSSFIYYGDNLNKDLALPTALDGFKHNYISKYFDYTLLIAREAETLQHTKAKLFGAKLKTKPLSWLDITGFYFGQNKKYSFEGRDITSNLGIYGAGVDIKFSQTAGLNFYYAHNTGNKESVRNMITLNTNYKGYAFNGEIYFDTPYKIGILTNKMGFYVLSEEDKFYTFPNKKKEGIIYGAMDYEKRFQQSPKSIYADLEFNFNKYPFLYTGLGIYVYASNKEAITNHTYYAKEFNINAGVKFEKWGINLSAGLFEGEAIFLGNTNTELQRIKKLQAKFHYNFNIK